jgi:hypothetical protein
MNTPKTAAPPSGDESFDVATTEMLVKNTGPHEIRTFSWPAPMSGGLIVVENAPLLVEVERPTCRPLIVTTTRTPRSHPVPRMTVVWPGASASEPNSGVATPTDGVIELAAPAMTGGVTGDKTGGATGTASPDAEVPGAEFDAPMLEPEAVVAPTTVATPEFTVDVRVLVVAPTEGGTVEVGGTTPGWPVTACCI